MSGAYADRRGGRSASGACEVDGCQNTWHCRPPALGKYLCQKHYARWRRHGTVHTTPGRRLPDKEVRRLRRLLGMPEEPPDRKQKIKWTLDEKTLP